MKGEDKGFRVSAIIFGLMILIALLPFMILACLWDLWDWYWS